MSAPSGQPAVRVQGLTKRFGGFTAVDGVTFDVDRGTIFGFLGPNGAGKTTTIRMLLGLLAPTSGQATVLGLDIVRQAAEIKQHIGYMSQRFSLYDDLSVGENLDFYGRTYGVRGRQLRERKESVLRMAGLENRRRDLTRTLAGGLKQRLALGAAILHRPAILFLDEPTAGVDPISRRAFWDLLYDLAVGGTTVLVTTHYMDEAEHCQRLAFIQHGRLVAQGAPLDVKEHEMRGQVIEIDCRHPALALPALRGLAGLDEVALYGDRIHVVAPDAQALRPLIAATLLQAGAELRSMDWVAPSLEDVFISSARRPAAAREEAPPVGVEQARVRQ